MINRCHCGGKLLVVNVDAKEGRVRRRKECSECGARTSTYEITISEYNLLVESRRKLFQVIENQDKVEKKLNEVLRLI